MSRQERGWTAAWTTSPHRFPDLLAQRLMAAGRPRAVLNQGIGGNRDAGYRAMAAAVNLTIF